MFATLVGELGLLFWAVSTCLVAMLRSIPPYELLSIVFFIGFCCSVLYNTFVGEWRAVFEHPFYMWLVGIIGICGNEILFVFSIKKAPVIQVDMISCLYPVIIVLLSALYVERKFHKRYIVSLIIAFLGVLLLLSSQGSLFSFEKIYISGYLCAFTAAILWSVYTVLSKIYNRPSPELVGLYCFFGLIFSIIMHLNFEETVMPNYYEFWLLIIVGIFTHCLSYLFWDFGVKRGDLKVLSVLSYANPIISAFLLILFGLASPSFRLFISAFMIALAAVISNVRWERIELYNFVRKK